MFPKIAEQNAEGPNTVVFFSGCSKDTVVLKTVELATIYLWD